MIILWRKSFSRGLSLIEVSLFSIVLSLATVHSMLAYKDYANKRIISMVSFELSTLSDALEKYIQISQSKLVKEDLSLPKEVNINVLYESGLLSRRSKEYIIFGQNIKLYIKKEKILEKHRFVGLLLTTGGKPMNDDLVKSITLLQGGRGGETIDGNLFYGLSGGWSLNLSQDWNGVRYSGGHLLLLIEPNVATISNISDVYNNKANVNNEINIASIETCFKRKCLRENNIYSPNWYPVYNTDALIVNIDSGIQNRHVLEVASSDTKEILHRSFHKEKKITLLPKDGFLNKNLDITISRVDQNGRKVKERVVKVSALASKNNAKNKMSIANLWGGRDVLTSFRHNGKTIQLDEINISDGDCSDSLIRDVTLRMDKISYTLKKGKSNCENLFITESPLFSENFINNNTLVPSDHWPPDANFSQKMTVDVGDITLNDELYVIIKFIPDDEEQNDKK